jgi:DNA-binding MarR family transcriptional regulator
LLPLTNKSKYVNMTDIISRTCDRKVFNQPKGRFQLVHQDNDPSDENLFWFIEAFFFAYRDLITDPDRFLSEIGFGRAHHRVLHFVDRYPGMRVADLLEILQITKQSLARVLRELIKEGYIMQRSGKSDRRERLLYVTPRGHTLMRHLAEPQLTKMRQVLKGLGEDRSVAVAKFLEDMASGTGRIPTMQRFQENGNALSERS